MSSKRRGWVNDPDIFCYICGSFVPSVQRQNITPFVKNVNYVYFGVKLKDQDKAWAPHKVCRHWKAKVLGIRCSNGLVGDEWTWQRMLLLLKCCCWIQCLKKSIKFNIPTCLMPYDRFLIGLDVPIPVPPRVLETVEDSVSEESLSDSQLKECSRV